MHSYFTVQRFSQCSKFFLMALGVVFCTISLTTAQIREAQAQLLDACEVAYDGDPSELNDSNVIVPDEVVALSATVRADRPRQVIEQTAGAPSVFLIIDHSGSMYTEDRDGLRFSVASALIDTLYATFDSAEVGVAVFRQYLFYYEGDDSRFVKTPEQDTGAYMPFVKLDSSYAPTGDMGYDILKQYLATETRNNRVELVYQPTNPYNNAQSTHINAGIDAAQHAFQSAHYPPDRQFIIFFSDGEATYPGNGSSSSPESNTYIQDVSTGIPTTFTIFFTGSGIAPASLDSMTVNIRASTYSNINDSSNLWPIDLGSTQLMEFLRLHVLSIIRQQLISTPLDITVNGARVDNYDTTGGGFFTFDQVFPLTDWTTHFQYLINYQVADSISVRDSSASGEFDVTIDPSVTTLPNSFPNSFTMECWQRMLTFYNAGTEILLANETMNNLEIRFYWEPGDAEYNYTNVKVDLYTTEGSGQDHLALTLTNSGTYFSSSFTQQVQADNQTPNTGNNTLEHYAFDSLVAIFHNSESPELPLDTLRWVIPFQLSGYIQAERAYYYDNNADGYVDSIHIVVTTDIAGGITAAQLDEIMDKDLIDLPNFRDFEVTGYSLVSDGFALNVTENTGHDPATYIRDDDSIIVSQDILSIGGWVQAGKIPIYDKVAPIILHEQITYKGKKEWTPLLIDYQTDTVSDTLTVIFSEPVQNITDPVPFYFYNPDSNVVYTANLTQVELNGATAKFTVQGVNSTVITYFSSGDSVYIHEVNRVADICENETGGEAHNFQNNINNQKQELTVKSLITNIGIIPVSITPFDVNDINNPNIVIPDVVINLLIDANILNQLHLQTNNNGDYIGILIQIIPDFINADTTSLKDLWMEGTLSIFDAVGNELVSNAPMVFNNTNKTLNTVWSGRNLNDRMVGSGSYLGVANVTQWPKGRENDTTKKIVKRIFIGVKD